MRFSLSHVAMAMLLGCVCIILSPREASGEANAIVPAHLRHLNTDHAEALGAVSRQRSERVRLAKSAYAVALQAVQQKVTAAGDLDAALAVKTSARSSASNQ